MTTTVPSAERNGRGTDSWLDRDVPWCFTPEQRQWQSMIGDLAERHVAPTATDRYINATFDEDIIERIGATGMYGLMVPEEHGGGGGVVTNLCIGTEELGRADSGISVSAHVQAISVALLDHMIRDDQAHLRSLLPRMLTGEDFISFGLTEPSGGSDAGDVQTRAVRDGDSWVINGSKEFITNSGTPRSRYVIAFAATGQGERDWRPQISAFLVPLDAEGVAVGPEYDKLGWRTSDTHPIYFDDVRVGADALLGHEGRAYGEALGFLTWTRLPIASMCVGVAQACLEESLKFVRGRRSFGVPIGSHQGVAFQIADIATKTVTSRAVTYDACYRYDHGLPFDQQAAICKLMASELANQAAFQATQVHGGYGFVNESAVTRHYADARIMTIGEGTSEVQRLLIARQLGLPV